MEGFNQATEVVDTFDIDQATAAVSIQNLLSYDEVIKYLKSSRVGFGVLYLSSYQDPLSTLLSKQSSAKQGFIEGWSQGYAEALIIFKQAIKYSWDPNFTISNLVNLYKNYEIKYKDSVLKNQSSSRKSFRTMYHCRTALCAIIDTWKKYTKQAV
ncbi:MAG: hypothetical protein KBA53_14350 [Thermoclostridium sp.]|nr:hypothetical protein [Thermoclostridium sp.]